jgi:deoxyribonuclease V
VPEEWPATAPVLIAEQERLATVRARLWAPHRPPEIVAGCFVCFEPSGTRPDEEHGWAAACWSSNNRPRGCEVARAAVVQPYVAGLLALREGPLLEAAVTALPLRPDLLLVNATGRDHPRRAGLALHLGAKLDLPTVGVTDRPLLATGEPPGLERGESTPLMLEGELVGHFLRTRSGTRPVAVHAGWRTDASVALRLVRACLGRARTPEPIRRARRAARLARAGEEPRGP